MVPQHVLTQIRNVKSDITVNPLHRTYYYGTVDKSARSLPCSTSVVVIVTLRVCHAANLMMRGMQWVVSDSPVKYVTIARRVLQALGMDTRKLLAAACQRLSGMFNVPKLLQKPESTCSINPSSRRTIHSLLSNSCHTEGIFYGKSSEADEQLSEVTLNY